jgi:pyrroline-5-carboxylate reductase
MVEIARNSNFVIVAEQMKALYDEFVQAGFSEAQALELVKEYIQGSKE